MLCNLTILCRSLSIEIKVSGIKCLFEILLVIWFRDKGQKLLGVTFDNKHHLACHLYRTYYLATTLWSPISDDFSECYRITTVQCILGQSSDWSPKKLRWLFCHWIFRNDIWNTKWWHNLASVTASAWIWHSACSLRMHIKMHVQPKKLFQSKFYQ